MYKGYMVMEFNDKQMGIYYGNKEENLKNLSEKVYTILNNNQYLIIKQEGKPLESQYIIDVCRLNGDQLYSIKYPVIQNKYNGQVKPKNFEQLLAMDMLRDEDIRVKVLTGVYGSGKDYLMINAAFELIDSGAYEKIVYVRNNISVKDTNELGALPGEALDKIMPFLMPFADHVGGQDGLFQLIQGNVIEAQHLGFIRGRDIKNSIILSSEAENLTTAHVQLLLGRVGEGSALWLNGDNRQTDREIFRRDSGLEKIVSKLNDHSLFGYVHMSKSERSEVARLADLLD